MHQCVRSPNEGIAAMGYALRMNGTRYTEWYLYSNETWLPKWDK